MKRRLLAIAAVGLAGAIASAMPALAYTESPAGTYHVTNAELVSAFGAGATLANITFDVESGFTWYNVPCKKDLKSGKKSITRDFKRQSHLVSTETVTPSTDGFTVVVTGTALQSNVKCPSGFVANGSPSQIAQSPVTHLVARYQGMDVELAKS